MPGPPAGTMPSLKSKPDEGSPATGVPKRVTRTVIETGLWFVDEAAAKVCPVVPFPHCTGTDAQADSFTSAVTSSRFERASILRTSRLISRKPNLLLVTAARVERVSFLIAPSRVWSGLGVCAPSSFATVSATKATRARQVASPFVVYEPVEVVFRGCRGARAVGVPSRTLLRCWVRLPLVPTERNFAASASCLVHRFLRHGRRRINCPRAKPGG